MKTESVTCDGCGADLTTRTNAVDYRLVLASESKSANRSGLYTDMHISPELKRAHHFCGVVCLARLLSSGEWKLPRQTRDILRKEFEAAARAAFPLAPPQATKPEFDRNAYQREYMRKRRAAEKETK